MKKSFLLILFISLMSSCQQSKWGKVESFIDATNSYDKDKIGAWRQYHFNKMFVGDDWKGKFDFLKDEGVEVVYLRRTPEISSTKMKQDIHDFDN